MLYPLMQCQLLKRPTRKVKVILYALPNRSLFRGHAPRWEARGPSLGGPSFKAFDEPSFPY